MSEVDALRKVIASIQFDFVPMLVVGAMYVVDGSQMVVLLFLFDSAALASASSQPVNPRQTAIPIGYHASAQRCDHEPALPQPSLWRSPAVECIARPPAAIGAIAPPPPPWQVRATISTKMRKLATIAKYHTVSSISVQPEETHLSAALDP